MTVVLKERFLRAWAGASAAEQASILQVVLNLEAILRNPRGERGTGLRKLHPSEIWEVRVGLSQRALFLLREDTAIFVFLGTHDEVRRFLRSL